MIVDEAHHVASRSYQMLLDLVGDAEIHDVVGLTATPWGQGERQDRIDAAFPQRVISRTREELIADGVLAAYTVTPVRTGLRIPVTAGGTRAGRARRRPPDDRPAQARDE